MKSIVDKAVNQCSAVEIVFLFTYDKANTGPLSHLENDKYVLMNDLMKKVKPYCPCEPMDSEDTLFILYTSGSTGKPKGIQSFILRYLLKCYHH